MTKRFLSALLLLTMILAMGCSDDSAATTDGQVADTAVSDLGGGDGTDATAVDATAVDATAVDASTVDASAVDATAVDATKVDSTSAGDMGTDITPDAPGPDSCLKKTCKSAGADCGKIFDGCGGTVTCGVCTLPNVCGLVTANKCGCSKTWQISPVDSVGTVGEYSALGIDSAGGLHVVYRNKTANNLKYATRAPGGKWLATTLDATAGAGVEASLILDAKDGVHVAYYFSGTKRALRYAYLVKGGKWTIPVAVHEAASSSACYKSGVSNPGQKSAITIDKNGDIHISYGLSCMRAQYGRQGWDVYHATRKAAGTVWTKSIAKSGAGNVDIGGSTSIVVTSGGDILITYGHHTSPTSYNPSGPLNLLTRKGNIWTSTKIDGASAYTGVHSDLVLDATGAQHVSYYDGTNKDLRYASRSATSWTLASVEATGEVGQYSSILVDKVGGVHISYYDATNKALKYAVKTGTTWKTETVEKTSVGQYTSLALDKWSGIHITYYDAGKGDLKHAYFPKCP